MLVLRNLFAGKWRRKQLYQYLKKSVKHRSLTFFSMANPKLEIGGMLGERKMDIYDILHPDFIPKTIRYDLHFEKIEETLTKNNISFPLIVKPNSGANGKGVYKADNLKQLRFLLQNIENEDLIIQEFIALKREFSILYYCLPISKTTTAYSVIEKIYPYIIGDGKSTIRNLIDELNNNRLRWDFLNKKFDGRWEEVLPKNEKVIVDYIGNFLSGAEFAACPVEIPVKLGKVIYKAVTETAAIHFGRLDVKANSITELLAGEFQIIEINGAKAEPLELYTSNFTEAEKLKVLEHHWEMLDVICEEQRKLGMRPASVFSAIRSAFHFNRMMVANRLKD